MKRSELKDLSFSEFVFKLRENEKHDTVSWGKEKPPQYLSAHFPINEMGTPEDCTIEKFTLHKDGNITLYTNKGILKFWSYEYKREQSGIR